MLCCTVHHNLLKAGLLLESSDCKGPIYSEWSGLTKMKAHMLCYYAACNIAESSIVCIGTRIFAGGCVGVLWEKYRLKSNFHLWKPMHGHSFWDFRMFCLSHCSIGKGTGYTPSELANMKDGSTLIIGGKEIEVFAWLCIEGNVAYLCMHDESFLYHNS